MMTSSHLPALLSDCSLSLRVASAPLVDAAPPSTTAASLNDAQQSSNVKQWATRLLNEPARHELYRGESGQFFLVTEIPRQAGDSTDDMLTGLLRAKQEAQLWATATCSTASAPLPRPGRLPRRESLGLGIAAQSSFSTVAAGRTAGVVSGPTQVLVGEEGCKEVGFWLSETEKKRLGIWQFSLQLGETLLRTI